MPALAQHAEEEPCFGGFLPGFFAGAFSAPGLCFPRGWRCNDNVGFVAAGVFVLLHANVSECGSRRRSRCATLSSERRAAKVGGHRKSQAGLTPATLLKVRAVDL